MSKIVKVLVTSDSSSDRVDCYRVPLACLNPARSGYGKARQGLNPEAAQPQDPVEFSFELVTVSIGEDPAQEDEPEPKAQESEPNAEEPRDAKEGSKDDDNDLEFVEIDDDTLDIAVLGRTNVHVHAPAASAVLSYMLDGSVRDLRCVMAKDYSSWIQVCVLLEFFDVEAAAHHILGSMLVKHKYQMGASEHNADIPLRYFVWMIEFGQPVNKEDLICLLDLWGLAKLNDGLRTNQFFELAQIRLDNPEEIRGLARHLFPPDFYTNSGLDAEWLRESNVITIARNSRWALDLLFTGSAVANKSLGGRQSGNCFHRGFK